VLRERRGESEKKNFGEGYCNLTSPRKSLAPFLFGRSPPQGEGGFTLIEVLVALTILSISLAALLAIFTEGLDRARESRNEAAARVLAQSLLAQAKVSPNPSMGDSGGRINGYLWHMRVLPFGSVADRASWQADAAEVSARVSWLGDGGMRSITLSTLRYIPRPGTKAQSDSDSDSDSE
jgi:general secretion pathway protein I